MSKLKTVALSDFLRLYRIKVLVQDDKNYKQVTISKSRGVLCRGEKQGINIGRKRQFIIDLDQHPNTLLFTRQTIIDGAIGIAPSEVDRSIATENMPMMSVDTNVIEMEYLKKLLVSEYFFEKIRKVKASGSAQKSIHERDFLKINIQIPSKVEQALICKKFKLLDHEHTDLNFEISNQKDLLKKLRQQILQDAIEGKLTKDWCEQNPNVEPASELLKRIQAEKEQLIKDKKIKKQKALPVITDDEKQFELPESWEWDRLGNICSKVTDGFHNTPKKLDNGRIYISATHIRETGVKWNSCLYVSENDHQELYRKTYPQKGEILITNRGAGCATPAIIDIEEQFSFQNAALIGFNQGMVNNKYIYFLILKMRDEIMKVFVSGGLQPMLSNVKLREIPVSFPPFEEQKEIVKKVKKLFAICDQLEGQITSSQTNAEQLMQSVLKEAFSQESAA